MHVTLKKAAALATALAAVSVPLESSVTLSIFSDEDPEKLVSNETTTLTDNINKSMAVNNAVYAIRSLIGRANEGTINNLLTERALLDKQLALLNRFVQTNTRPPDWAAVTKQIASLRDTPQPSGGYNLGGRTANAISIQLPTNDLVTDEIRALKKRRIAVEDQLAELNFKNTIELPEDVVTLLREFDLV